LLNSDFYAFAPPCGFEDHMKITGASCIFFIRGRGAACSCLLDYRIYPAFKHFLTQMVGILNNIGPTPSKEGRVPNGSQLCLKQVFASKRTSTNGG